MAHEYVTAADLKETLSLGAQQTYADDDIARALTAASRAVDGYCHRRFWVDADANQVRYYTPDNVREVPIDDLVTLTTVEVDLTGTGTFAETWALNTDFVVGPFNAAADGEPYTLLTARRSRLRGWPLYERTVKVTGRFGWPAIPDPVVDATSIIAARLVKRKREAPTAAAKGINGQALKVINDDTDLQDLLGSLVNYAG